MALAQPATPSAAGQPTTVLYVILGDEARRALIERLLGNLESSGFSSAASSESGMDYAGCVGAWRANPSQAIACVQSRLARHRGSRTVVLSTYERAARPNETVVTCMGSGGHGRMMLRPEPASGDATALRNCLDSASHATRTARPGYHVTGLSVEPETADAAHRRAAAAIVLTIAVDHVGVPRGITGICLVEGRIHEVLRGRGQVAGSRIGLSIPCAAGRGRSGPP